MVASENYRICHLLSVICYLLSVIFLCVVVLMVVPADARELLVLVD